MNTCELFSCWLWDVRYLWVFLPWLWEKANWTIWSTTFKQLSPKVSKRQCIEEPHWKRERNLFKNDDRNRLFSVSKNSASKVKYDETNELVEKLSKIFHFLVTKVFIPGDIRHIYPPPLVHLATLWFVFVHRFCVTESYFLPFHIHFDWFGRRCFWAEYSTMVSFRLTFDHRLFMILINFLSIWNSKAPIQLETPTWIFGSCFSTNYRSNISVPLFVVFYYFCTGKLFVCFNFDQRRC